MVAVADEAILGSTYARLYTRPLIEGPPGPCGCGCALTPETSYGFEVDEFARDVLRRPLDPWQRWLVIHAGERLPSGLPRFRQLLVLVARQNGKTELLVILALYWLWIDNVGLVLGTSTKLDYARESWLKAVKLAKATPALARDLQPRSVRVANGEQTLFAGPPDESPRYKIAASNAEGGRSLTIDRLIMDELREHHDWTAYDAAEPATSAVPDAQLWMISNQGGDKSVVLHSLREQALAGADLRLGLFEWSAADGATATDVEGLCAANPNLGRRIALADLMGGAARAEAAGGEQLTGWLTERLCRYVPLLSPAIDAAAWERCYDPGDLEAARSRVALCLDISMDNLHASLYAAALVDNDRVRVENVAAWSGSDCADQLRRDLPALLAKVRPRALGWFPSGPAASFNADFAKRPGWPPKGVSVEAIRADIPAVCMGFAEQVLARQIAHPRDPLLDTHVAGAERAMQGDAWRFTRRGAGHVDALYAAAGATHLARTLPAPKRAFVLVAKTDTPPALRVR